MDSTRVSAPITARSPSSIGRSEGRSSSSLRRHSRPFGKLLMRGPCGPPFQRDHRGQTRGNRCPSIVRRSRGLCAELLRENPRFPAPNSSLRRPEMRFGPGAKVPPAPRIEREGERGPQSRTGVPARLRIFRSYVSPLPSVSQCPQGPLPLLTSYSRRRISRSPRSSGGLSSSSLRPGSASSSSREAPAPPAQKATNQRPARRNGRRSPKSLHRRLSGVTSIRRRHCQPGGPD